MGCLRESYDVPRSVFCLTKAGVSNYEPNLRRPIAAIFRQTGEAATRFCVRHGIHPDAISYLSVLAALVAASCFWNSERYRWLLIIGPLFCYLRLWFNMLDGMVAVAAGKASRRGEILNDLPDRISDIIIFVGLAHSGLMNPFIGYWAAIFALLTRLCWLVWPSAGRSTRVWRNYVQTVAHGRAYHWRMAYVFSATDISSATFTILDWTCLVVIAGCVQTIVVRLKRITAGLQDKR